MPRRSRIIRPAIALTTVAALLAGCADDDTSDRTADAESSPSVDSTPTESALPGGVLSLPDAGAGQESVKLDAGRYRIPLSDTLSYDIDLAQGTDASSDGLYLASGSTVIKAEAAGATYGLPKEPCTSRGDITPTGPTVDDLVTAIRNQPLYRTSRPEPVEIAGASGQYLELRIRSGYDASTCSEEQVALPGNPVTNNNMEPGYVGQWWFLDVAGQRAVIQIFCDQCDPDELDQATTAIRGITFTPTP